MRVIVAGSRHIMDAALVASTIQLSGIAPEITTLLSGTAAGVDTLAESLALETKTTVKRFVPEWEKLGKRAGPERQRQMLQEADACIIIWDGQSPGTKNLINMATTQMKPMYIKNLALDKPGEWYNQERLPQHQPAA